MFLSLLLDFLKYVGQLLTVGFVIDVIRRLLLAVSKYGVHSKIVQRLIVGLWFIETIIYPGAYADDERMKDFINKVRVTKDNR